jgi:DNA polymerase-1
LTKPIIVGFDCETDLISVGCKTPTLVCLTLAGGPDSEDLAADLAKLSNAQVDAVGDGWGALVGADDALEAFRLASQRADVLVAHNMPYDVAVLANTLTDIRATKAPNAVLRWAAEAIESGALRDTLVREKLIAIALDYTEFDRRFNPVRKASFSLARLVEVYFDVDISGDKTKLDLKDTHTSEWPQKAAEYAVEDAVWARGVFMRQGARPLEVDGHAVIRPDGDVVNERAQTAAWLALHLMAAEGVNIDSATVDLFERDIDDLLEEYNRACRALGIVRINRCYTCASDKSGGTGYVGQFPQLRVCPTCNAQDHETCLQQAVYKREAQGSIGKLYTKRLAEIVRWGYRGDPPLTERPAKQSPAAYNRWTPSIKTDEETLEAINHPEVQRYVTGKKATKWRGTYLPPLRAALEDGGRLTSSPNVLVRSGRTSWTGPNLQNPPRKGRFRECFCAPAGSVFASVDYSTLELAVLAQVNRVFFGESRMAELINAGVDLHAWFGAKLLGITYERMQELLAAGDAQAKAIRQLAKIPNFGLPGGLGAKGLVKYALGYGVILAIDEPTTNEDGVVLPSARDLCRAWKEAFPEMKSYFGYLSTCSDMSGGKFSIKQLGSERVRGGATYTSGANSYFQGLAADGAKAAMWELFKACYIDTGSPLFGCRVWSFIHDEFLLCGPRETAHLWAPEVSRIMVETMRRYTPDVAQAAPPALMERWYKGADPVRDEEGVLLVWVPFDDLPADEQARAPGDLSKNGRILYASGFMDARHLGASLEEAREAGEELARSGSLG